MLLQFSILHSCIIVFFLFCYIFRNFLFLYLIHFLYILPYTLIFLYKTRVFLYIKQEFMSPSKTKYWLKHNKLWSRNTGTLLLVKCLSPFRLLWQNITDWVVGKYLKYGNLLLTVWRRKSKIRMPPQLGESPLLNHRLLVVSSHNLWGKLPLWNLFYKGTIPFMRAPPSRSTCLPKSPTF